MFKGRQRIMALLLSAAMVFGPETIPMNVLAATDSGAAYDVISETEAYDSDGVLPEYISDETVASDETIDTGYIDDTDEGKSADTVEDNAAYEDEDNDSGEVFNGDEEDADAVLTDIDESEISDDGDLEEETGLPADEEMITDSEEETEIPDTDIDEFSCAPLGTASDCFETEDVGGKQVLKLKASAELPASVVIPQAAQVIPAGIFTGNETVAMVTFEEGSALETIEDGAFAGVKNLREVNGIPTGLTAFSDNVFKNDSALTTLTYTGESNITSIGEMAFYNTGISRFYAPKATSVGESAFALSTSLQTTSFGNLVTIGDNAFNGCSAFSTLSITSNALVSIGDSAFASSGITALDLSGVSTNPTLGTGLCQDCDRLTSVKLPANLTAIPDKAFLNCISLKTKASVGLETCNVESIGASAYGNCTGLTELIFSETIKSYGARAFIGCSALTDVYIKYQDPSKAVFSIADDAFPATSKLTLHGYDGKVKTYAAMRGCKFATLYNAFKITVNVSGKGAAKAYSGTKEIKSALPGTVVSIMVIPEKGHATKDITFSGGADVKEKLSEWNALYQIFTYTQPAAEMTVNVTTAETTKMIKGTLGFDVRPMYGYDPLKDVAAKSIGFDIAGRETELYIMDGMDETKDWYWDFTSSNKSVATINSDGVIRAVSSGSTTITAKLKANNSKKITISVSVGADSNINKMDFDLSDSFKKAIAPGQLLPAVDETDPDETRIILFDSSEVAQVSKSFNLSIFAYDTVHSGLQNLIVKSKWSSTDTGVVSLAKTSSANNANTLTVKKGASGEVTITVSITNPGSNKVDVLKTIIIRVIDFSPRLKNSTLTVNSLLEYGTILNLIPVYGYGIDTSKGLRLVTATKSPAVWNACKDPLVIKETSAGSGVFYVANSNTKKPFAKEYTNLYIEGELADSHGVGTGILFHVPIKKLTVKNAAIDPVLTTTGKINVFYNSTAYGTAYDSKIGRVKFKSNISNPEVEDYVLVDFFNANEKESFETAKKRATDDKDSLAHNFDITYDNGTNTFVVTRSSKALKKYSNGQIANTGFLYIKYKGYSACVKKFVIVPVKDTAPSYVLKKASGTGNKNASMQTYTLKLVDKKTKKKVVDLSELDPDPTKGLVLNASTSAGLFEAIDMEHDIDLTSNTFTLKVRDIPRNGKAVINVKMAHWYRTLNYTYTLTAVTKKPVAKFKTATATLNKAYPLETALLTASLDQTDASLEEFSAAQTKFTGKASRATDAAKLIAAMDFSEPGQITAGLPADVATGTYSFKTVPNFKYLNNTLDYTAKSVEFKVVVKDQKPVLKLKKSTFALNAIYPGEEIVTTKYTMSNLPTGRSLAEVTIDDSAVTYTPSSSKAPAFSGTTGLVKSISFTGGVASVQLNDNDSVKYNRGSKFKYKVSGLKAEIDTVQSTVADFYITISLINKRPKVTVKTSGALNPIDATTGLKCKVTVKNMVSNVEGIEVYEINGNNLPILSTKFDAYDITGKTAYVRIKPGAAVKNNKKYKLMLKYKLSSAPAESMEYTTAKFTVTTKQTLPGIQTNISKATVYAGQVDPAINISVTKKKPAKGKKEIIGVMTGVKFADNTPDAIKNAFDISFTQDTENHGEGIVTLELKHPELIAQNKSYDLVLYTIYDKQITGTNGNKIKIKVTVKK